METKRKSAKVVVSLLALAGLLVFSLFAVGGSLEPSAPPGPTMKTLDEVEPRTPISSVPYTITESGSYYLSANAPTTSNMFSGITIWADNVTLDLKGFSLIGDGTAELHGVVIEGDYKNITIRNGTITNWGGNGVEGSTATKCRVEDLQVIDNAGSGIHLPGKKQRVKNCMASDNGDSATGDVYGISAGDCSTVTGNMVYDNGNSASGVFVYGIYADTGSTVTGNLASYNGDSSGAIVYGIYADTGCTISGNTAHYNGELADGLAVFGIRAEEGCTVTANTAYYNGYVATGDVYGIFLSDESLVDQNTAVNNGLLAGSATNMTLGVAGCVYGNNVAP